MSRKVIIVEVASGLANVEILGGIKVVPGKMCRIINNLKGDQLMLINCC